MLWCKISSNSALLEKREDSQLQVVLCSVLSHLDMPRMQLVQFEGRKLPNFVWMPNLETDKLPIQSLIWCESDVRGGLLRCMKQSAYGGRAGNGSVRREFQVVADGSVPCIHVCHFNISQTEHALLHNGTILMVAHSECKISSERWRKRIVSYKRFEIPLPAIQWEMLLYNVVLAPWNTYHAIDTIRRPKIP